MRRELAALTCGLLVLSSIGIVQGLSQATVAGPTFEVVSIRRNTSGRSGSREDKRSDGAFTMTNVAVATLITRAYPPSVPRDMVGLPDWTVSETYDVSTTSTLQNATPEDGVRMLRAMLADRFKLAVHFEKRELPAFDLALARANGRLEPGMKLSENNCAEPDAQTRPLPSASADAAPSPKPEIPDFTKPPSRCTLRVVDRITRDNRGDGQGKLGDLLEGESTMSGLAATLGRIAGRSVVDKTALPGSYRLRMNFDATTSRRGPEAAPAPDDALPSVFTAVREQLGLKLEPSRVPQDVLVIDRIERPSEN